jgi:hypothetical protein
MHRQRKKERENMCECTGRSSSRLRSVRSNSSTSEGSSLPETYSRARNEYLKVSVTPICSSSRNCREIDVWVHNTNYNRARIKPKLK